jgi:hypothetical protein
VNSEFSQLELVGADLHSKDRGSLGEVVGAETRRARSQACNDVTRVIALQRNGDVNFASLDHQKIASANTDCHQDGHDERDLATNSHA